MERNIGWKALIALLALALLTYGIMQMQSDPTLRKLLTVDIATLEGGAPPPRPDQYIEVKNAYLMPMYMISYSHSRKRGDSAHVFVPLGSQAMQAVAFDDKKVKPLLWVRLAQDFKTKEAAEAAMQVRSLYEQPYAVSGVVRDLESDVREEMSKSPDLTIETPVSLHDGTSPISYGGGAGLTLAGALLLAVVGLWAAADAAAQRWSRTLAGPEAAVFVGKSAHLIVALLGTPLFVACGGSALSEWMDTREVDIALIVAALVGLAMVAWGLWRSRAAAVLTADSLSIVRPGGRTTVPLSEVTGLLMDERKVRGVKVSAYTLQGPAKPVKVGSSWFKGGIDDATGLGTQLREHLTQRLAPVLQARLARGERVAFGPVFIGHDGIGKGKDVDRGELLPWSEVASATLKNGQLKIKQKGKMLGWGKFAVNKIVNFDLLMHVFGSKGV